MENDLIDEYILAVQPKISGSGKPLFCNLTKQPSLKLINTLRLKSGVVILHYKPHKLQSSPS
jgi:dihydrofolate reductase